MPRAMLIQVRRDSAADWTSADPVLADGEHGYETDTGKFKIGDGASDWSALDYFEPGAGGGASDWGDIGGTLADQTDLQTALNAKQPLDAELTALAGLTSAADKGIQFTGAGTAATFDLTTAGKALLDDANAAAQRTTLGLAIGTDVQAASVLLDALVGAGAAVADRILGALSNDTPIWLTAAQVRTLLGLVIGTNVQAYDAELAAIAGLTSAADKGIQFTGAGTAATFDLTTAGKALLDDADAAAQRTTLGLGALATIATVGTSQIDNDAVTYAKIQNVTATDKVLGRSTSGAGDVEEIACTAAGRALLDDADNTAQRDTLALGTAATPQFAGVGVGTPGASGQVRILNGAAAASVTDGVILFAEDVSASSKLKVRDEAGNITTISPHEFALLDGPSEPMAWAYYSEREINGKRHAINVDMLRLARAIERLSGERLVEIREVA